MEKVEPKGPPKIVNGMADWVDKKIKKNKSKPYTQNIVNTHINRYTNVPMWARITHPENATSLKDDKFFWNFFENAIKMNKITFSHMQTRMYDPMWEVNLNHPSVAIRKPYYVAKDIVRLYGDARKVVDSIDAGAWLIGPNCSSPIKNLAWNEPLFKEGLLKYIDAYNCHGYHPPPPETGLVREKVRALKEMIKKYNNNKLLPLICTELGYRSWYGEDLHKDHARWHARVSIILKGEGFKTYYPFYSYDFGKMSNSWGINYNLDKKMKFASKRVSPKAAVPALAVCIDQLEGTKPITDIAFFNDDIWCYSFQNEKTQKVLVTLWSVNYNHKLLFPAGEVKQLEITNIMGHKSFVPVKKWYSKLANNSKSDLYSWC